MPTFRFNSNTGSVLDLTLTVQKMGQSIVQTISIPLHLDRTKRTLTVNQNTYVLGNERISDIIFHAGNQNETRECTSSNTSSVCVRKCSAQPMKKRLAKRQSSQKID